MVTTVELAHPTDPRYLFIEGELPEEITIHDLSDQKYGKLLTMVANPVDVRYESTGVGRWTKT